MKKAPKQALLRHTSENRIPFPSWPEFAEDEIEAVNCVLRSGKVNYWTGSECEKFEKEFASFCSTKFAIALANGTVALELALRILDIGPGDEVVVTPRTFIASASSVIMCGAKPVFADVDVASQNITVDSIQKVLSPNTKAIILVHLAGWPCDMDPILQLAHEYNLKVIEDCAQAHGATYKGRPAGSLGDVAAYSFCQDKIITTGGEGGMLLTNEQSLWERAWSFKDHGKSFKTVYRDKHPPGFRWLHDSFGTNLRMTEMQATIGRIQLRKLSKWIERRRSNAFFLMEGFRNIPALRVPEPPPYIRHSYYKFYSFVRLEHLKRGWNRDKIIETVNSEGVPCFSGSCPEVYMEKTFRLRELQPMTRLQNAKKLGETSLMFLVHPTLRTEHMAATRSVIEEIFSTAVN